MDIDGIKFYIHELSIQANHKSPNPKDIIRELNQKDRKVLQKILKGMTPPSSDVSRLGQRLKELQLKDAKLDKKHHPIIHSLKNLFWTRIGSSKLLSQARKLKNFQNDESNPQVHDKKRKPSLSDNREESKKKTISETGSRNSTRDSEAEAGVTHEGCRSPESFSKKRDDLSSNPQVGIASYSAHCSGSDNRLDDLKTIDEKPSIPSKEDETNKLFDHHVKNNSVHRFIEDLDEVQFQWIRNRHAPKDLMQIINRSIEANWSISEIYHGYDNQIACLEKIQKLFPEFTMENIGASGRSYSLVDVSIPNSPVVILFALKRALEARTDLEIKENMKIASNGLSIMQDARDFSVFGLCLAKFAQTNKLTHYLSAFLLNPAINERSRAHFLEMFLGEVLASNDTDLIQATFAEFFSNVLSYDEELDNAMRNIRFFIDSQENLNAIWLACQPYPGIKERYFSEKKLIKSLNLRNISSLESQLKSFKKQPKVDNILLS